jgi:putative FmdB family regulatory protein
MTYEYLCAECQHAWEEEQSISAPATETCPSCGQKSAKRQVSGGVGFILKGGGWYADGYGSGAAKKSDESKPQKTDDKAASSTSDAAKSSSTKSEPASSDSKSGDSAKGDSGKGGGASGDSAASPPA